MYVKAEELLKELYPVLEKFPKSEKYSLTQDIRQAFYSLLKSLQLANNMRHKRRMYQEEADAYLKLIPIFFNLAKSQRYINSKTNLKVQTRVVEIGRMLGGWMKSTR